MDKALAQIWDTIIGRDANGDQLEDQAVYRILYQDYHGAMVTTRATFQYVPCLFYYRTRRGSHMVSNEHAEVLSGRL